MAPALPAGSFRGRPDLGKGADILLERDASAAKALILQHDRPADAIHAEMPEIGARRIPAHQIPQRRQDQHRLRFDRTAGVASSGVALVKGDHPAVEKGKLERGQQVVIHAPHIRQVLKGR